MQKRHIAKTFSYRLLSSTIGFFVLFYTTGSFSIGATWSLSELFFKPIIYYCHERFWYKYIKFGIKK